MHSVIGGPEGERRLGGERVSEEKEGTITVSMRGGDGFDGRYWWQSVAYGWEGEG